MDAKEKKYWIIGILALIALVVFVIWRKKNQELQKAEDVPNEAEPVNLTDDKKVVPASTFPLKMGSKGAEVLKLQAYMLRKYGFQGKIDGIWGPETNAKVKQFLKVDTISEEKYKSMGL